MKNSVARTIGAGLAGAAVLALAACTNGTSSLQSGSAELVSSGGEVVDAAGPFVVLDAVSLINTDKTIIDHIAGGVTGEDCSTLRSMDGGHYCQPHYENKPVAEPLYCYRTLAKVTCYNQPSPNPADRLVGMRPGGELRTY